MNVLESKASSLLQYSRKYTLSSLLNNNSPPPREKLASYTGYQINTFKSSFITDRSYEKNEERSEFVIYEDSEIQSNRNKLNKSLKNSFSKRFEIKSKGSTKRNLPHFCLKAKLM